MPTSAYFEQVFQINPQLVKALNEVYTASFPPEQRADLAGELRSLNLQRDALFVARENQAYLGFGILRWLPGCSLFALDYLAIHPQQRGRQLGSGLLADLKTFAFARSDGLIFEVEPADEGSQAERRIAFYQRQGGRIIPGPQAYRIPNLAGSGSLPMWLMWIPSDPKRPDLSGKALCDCIQEIYTHLYGKPTDDPLLAQVLQDCGCVP